MLAQVAVIQVPAQIYLYPEVIRKGLSYFYSINETSEDIKRTRMYQDASARKMLSDSSSSIDEYLGSLQLQMCISSNGQSRIPRIAQLTQKTNQFNLTTKRYTEADIHKFINSDNFTVFSFELKDRFGDFGLTGMSIVEQVNQDLCIDTFLLSCRVLGRGVENAFLKFILTFAKNKGFTFVNAIYIPTLKNEQVKNFYETEGFTLIEENNKEKKYSFDLSNFNNTHSKHIEISYGK
jgi:FkbH-like protein